MCVCKWVCIVCVELKNGNGSEEVRFFILQQYVSLKKAGVELNASTTRNVLLERCSSDVFAFGKKNNVSAITEIVQVGLACVRSCVMWVLACLRLDEDYLLQQSSSQLYWW